MKIKDLKALARQTLLDSYHKPILARLLASLLSLILALLCGVLLLFTLVNLGFLSSKIKLLIPNFAASRPAAIVGVILLTALLIFTIIFSIWVNFGYQKLLLRIARGEKCSTADILYGFSKEAHPWKILWTGLLCFILVLANVLLPVLVQALAVVCGYIPEEAEAGNPWSIVIGVVAILSACWMIYETMAFAFADLIVIDDPEIDVMDAIRKSMKITRGNKLRMFWLAFFSFLLWMIPMEIVPILGLWIVPYMEMTVVLFYLSISGGLKDNPAYRELFRNDYAEKVKNRVVAHTAQREEMKAEAAEKTAEAKEAAAEKLSEMKEIRTEAAEEVKEIQAPAAEEIEEIRTDAADEVKKLRTDAAQAAEGADAAVTGEVRQEAAEEAEAVRGRLSEQKAEAVENEVPVHHFPMGRVSFPDMDPETTNTDSQAKAEE